MQNLNDCLEWLDSLERALTVRTTGAWPLPAVLVHLAQIVEMSVEGFPLAKGALFQNTVGRAAFGVFRWRGRMSHGLAQPIPGAPALTGASDWRPAARRLRAAISRFDAQDRKSVV